MARQCIKVEYLRKIGYNNLVQWLENKDHVYVGREFSFFVDGAKKSIFCNPFTVKNYGRERCLEMYAKHLEENIVKNYKDEFLSLKGKTLGCFCLPNEECHVDVLLRCLEKY